MANRDIDVFAGKVDMVRRRRHPKIDLRMTLGKPAEPVDQPLGGKIRRRADRENARALALHQAFGARRDPIQRIADHGQIVATGFGHDQPLALAIEKLDAERRLQAL